MRRCITYGLVFSVFFILGCVDIYAQELLPDLIEIIQEDYPDMEIDQEQVELFLRMLESPLDINTSSKDALLQIPFLSERMIEEIHYYIFRYGPMMSIYELKAIPGFSHRDIKTLIPFLSVGEQGRADSNSQYKRLNDDVLVRFAHVLEEEKGFQDDVALGSPISYLIKNKMTYGNFTWYGTVEKDIGEAYFINHRPEYVSSALEYKGNGILEKVVVGDYKVHLGEGLIQASNVFGRKSAMVMQVRSKGSALRASTSADGAWFKRGLALHLKRNHFSSVVYASDLDVDATVYEGDDNPYFLSMRNGGYHRTLAEWSKRNVITLRELGGSLNYARQHMRMAFNGSYVTHDVSMMRNKDVYDEWWNMSMSGRGVFGPVQWWFESALDAEGHQSHIAACDLFPHKSMGLVLLGRYFDQFYYSYNGFAFSESGEPQNENGLYLGLELNPGSQLTINSYIDLFQFPGPRYNVSIPSRGWEGFVQAEGSSPSTDMQWFAKVKYEEKLRNYSQGTVYPVFKNQKYDFKVGLEYSVNFLELKCVLQSAHHRFVDANDWGWLVYQDFKSSLWEEKLRFVARVAFFHTPTYDTRLYAYENDVLYAFSVPAYWGNGLRYFLNLSLKIGPGLSTYFKLGYTRYSDREVIGSGFNEIQSDHKTDVKLQLRYRF